VIDAAMTSPAAVLATGVTGAASAEPGFDAVLAALMGVPAAAPPAAGEPLPPAVAPTLAGGTLASLLSAAMPTVEADGFGAADSPTQQDAGSRSAGEEPAVAPAADGLPADAPADGLPAGPPAVEGLSVDVAAASVPPGSDRRSYAAAARATMSAVRQAGLSGGGA
jgi:hypothetical protein